MTDVSAPRFPLSGSTTVEGPGFSGEFKWFTVGAVAFARHAIHSGQPQLSERDMEAFGRTLALLTDDLAVQGVTLRFGVERPLDGDDPWGLALAEVAGLSPAGSGLVLRRRLPVPAEDPLRSGSGSVGRPVRPHEDAEALAVLVASLPEFATTNPRVVVPVDVNDHVTVVDDDSHSSLAACCWARRMPPTTPGSPTTVEIVAIGLDVSSTPSASIDSERAAVAAMADLLSDDGIRTLSVCADDDRRPGMTTRFEKMGFVARRSRHLYERVVE